MTTPQQTQLPYNHGSWLQRRQEPSGPARHREPELPQARRAGLYNSPSSAPGFQLFSWHAKSLWHSICQCFEKRSMTWLRFIGLTSLLQGFSHPSEIERQRPQLNGLRIERGKHFTGQAKSPLPRILSSARSRSSFFLPNKPALFPPELRISPPPWHNGGRCYLTALFPYCGAIHLTHGFNGGRGLGDVVDYID